MSRGRIVWWLVFLFGASYFLVPLIATLDFSLKARPPLAGYENAFADPQFLGTLAFSFLMGLCTIAASILLLVPTAYWVRLRLPRLQIGRAHV